MWMPRVMPCLLVADGRLVKTVKFKNPAYVGDPVNAIKIYNEKEVDELIVLDITATIEQRPPQFEMLAEIVDECFMPLCYGGGVHNIDDMRRLFHLGIEKVALNSYAVECPDFLREAAARFGNQSIVASIDVKKSFLGKHYVHTHGGRTATKLDPVEFAQQVEASGAGEILLTSIDRDGTWAGYDLDLLHKVTGSVTIPVIACGGAGRVADFGDAVNKGGASAAAAGSMVVYQGQDLGVLINFPDREELQRVFAG